MSPLRVDLGSGFGFDGRLWPSNGESLLLHRFQVSIPPRDPFEEPFGAKVVN